jgi:hypothetical protein
MDAKPLKVPSSTSKKTSRDPERERPVSEDLTKNAPGPTREGPNHLHQRAEWFRRRTGGSKKK